VSSKAGRYTALLATHRANLPPPPTRTKKSCLSGSLTHLAALASKTTHALLLPLLTHTGGDGHSHLKGIITFDTVALESTLFEDIGPVHEADLVRRNEFGVLDLKLEGFDGGGGVDLVGSGSDKNLHLGSLIAFSM